MPEYHYHQTSRAEELQLPKFINLAIYRIASEAIHNVVKHAGANRYEVTLDASDDSFCLVVEDNGRGFDAEEIFDSSHRGLHNIRERARAIGARAHWKPSRFSSGTRFELILNLASINQEV